MKGQGFNWQIWAAVVLSISALLSYPFIFAEWAVTRDFPWANLLLFAIALLLLILGVRKGFAVGRGWLSKIGASVLALLSVLMLAGFVLMAFVTATWMPKSAGAPTVGQKAPDFTLIDTAGRTISLADLRTTPIVPGGSAPKGVLLIFYRGYW